MTLETYEKAKDLIVEIKNLDNHIYELKDIIRNNTSSWRMEVRPSTSSPLKCINHYGLLPEFLNTILSKHLEHRDKLLKELDQL